MICMNGMMKAQVFYDVGDLRLEEVPIPHPEPDQVLLRVHACGICGTDIGYYTGRAMPGTQDGKGPLILGHEFAGEVVELGSVALDRCGFRPGDRVTTDPVQFCGVCPSCRKGLTNMCRNARTLGVHVNGAFAEYTAVSYRNLYRIPDRVSYEDAALCEPLACALHGVGKLDVRFGDFVVIFGPGAIGQMMTSLIRARGASKIAVVGVQDYSLRRALDAGADYAFNTLEPSSPYYTADLIERIRSLTEGSMADCAITPTAAVSVQRDALAVTGGGGRVVYFGMPGEDATLTLPVMDQFRTEKSIRFSLMAPDTWNEAVAMIADGRIAAKDLVTQRFPLAGLEDGIRLLMDPSIEEKTKVMISCG